MRLLPLILAFPMFAYAHTPLTTVELVCPIGGEKFKMAQVGSSFISNRYLDLRPFGPGPAPWPLAKCPSNGFVIFRDKFSDSELDQLREFVATSEYRELTRIHRNYYLAAVLQRHIQAPPEQVAFTLLQATWQATSKQQYKHYAQEALDGYRVLLNEPNPDKEKWTTYQLVAGELERRIGNFDDATKRFSELKNSHPDDAHIQEIIQLQLSLIADRNTGTQLMPKKK